MAASVVCPGCGRPVRVSAGTVLRRARCSKCRSRLGPAGGRPPRRRADREPDPPGQEAIRVAGAESSMPRYDIDRGIEDSAPATQAEPLSPPPPAVTPPQPVVFTLDAPPAPPPLRRGWAVGFAVLLAALGLLVVGVIAYVAGLRDGSSDDTTVVARNPGVDAPGSPGTGRYPDRPPSRLDAVYRTGRARLDDGPADVTALGRCPADGAIVVGYADGSTRVFSLDDPAFEPPAPGPKADGAVRRIAFDPAGRVAYLTADRGLTAAPLRRPPKAPLVIPGESGVAFSEPTRERFAAVRNGRVHVRYIPMELATAAPPARAGGGFVVSTPQDEVLPLGVPATAPPPAGRPTFLAWQPGGRVVYGLPDGSVRRWPGAATPGREHRAAVRAWAVAADRPDFATGDAAGVVGYWPNGAAYPLTYAAAPAAITHLAFGPCHGDLLVADAGGGVAVWDAAGRVKLHELRRPEPPAAVGFGPADDVVLLADGKGVEVVWLGVR